MLVFKHSGDNIICISSYAGKKTAVYSVVDGIQMNYLTMPLCSPFGGGDTHTTRCEITHLICRQQIQEAQLPCKCKIIRIFKSTPSF